jgi:cell division protein FtsW
VLGLLSGSVLGLTSIGLVMVLSSSSVSSFARNGSSFTFFKRQLVYAAAGAVLGLLASRVPHRLWQRAWAPMLASTVLLLLLVLLPQVGVEAGGAARWISVGPVTLQPSEIAKFAVVAAAASILAKHLGALEDVGRWAVPLSVVLGMVVILVLLQPDLGTASVITVTLFVMLFAAGVRLRFLMWSAVGSTGVLTASIFAAGYRRVRFLSFLDPWADPHVTGYQVVQSLIALGSGHLVGVGLGASRQKWMYVPNAHTDFIFAILGEELGLAGELLVLAMFAAFVYAGTRIALRAPDPFGRLLAAGITGWIGIQALVNLGAVTGVLPITGVPLPFISFGGSALLTSLVASGVLVSIGRSALASPAPRAPLTRGRAGSRHRRGSP